MSETSEAAVVVSEVEQSVIEIDEDLVVPDYMHEQVASETKNWEADDYDFKTIVDNFDLYDVDLALATLEAYRVPFVRAARRAGRKNPAAEFYNTVNNPLFYLRKTIKDNIAAREHEHDGELDFELIRLRSSLEALTELIVRLNYGMTRKYVKQFTSNTSPDDSADFQGAANVGLMIAIDSFDPDRGKFGTWAYKPIQRAVLKAVRDADFKNLNEGDFEKRPKVLRAYNALLEIAPVGEDGEKVQPALAEIAALAEVHHDLVRRVLQAPHLDSLQQHIGDEEGNELGDVLPDYQAEFEDSVVAGMGIAMLMKYGMDSLDEREHYVIVRVFGLDGEAPEALAEIGNQLALSREAVRQIRGKGLAKLLHPTVLRRVTRAGR